MRRSTSMTRLSLVILGLTVISIMPARTEKKKTAVDSVLHKMMQASEKALKDHGRPDAISPDQMRYFKHMVIAGTPDGVPSVRVRMLVDPSTRQTIEQMGIRTYGRMDGFATAIVPIARLAEIADLPGVTGMQAAHVLQKELDVSRVEVGSASVATTYASRGKGVVVGSIDTGVDWRNPDFRNPDGTTRIKYLWNQDDACGGVPAPPPPFDTGGCLYTEADINAALLGGPPIVAPDADGHGSHTLGVSSGNGRNTVAGQPAYVGMAPEADIIVVKTFAEPGDTTDCMGCGDLSGGLEFIDQMAASLGEPYVVNMSLGHQFGSHDGADFDEMTIDSLIGAGIPGRAIVKSAGNERGHAIHIGGTVTAGATNTHQLVIPAYTPLAGDFNDIVDWQFWYSNGDNMTLTISDPQTSACGLTALSVTLTTGGGQASNVTSSGVMLIDENGSPAPNGFRFFDMEIDDQLNRPPCAGTWLFKVKGNTITAGGRYDAWIWNDSFGISNPPGEALWATPENARTISIPGTAFDVTTAGGYYTKLSWPSIKGGNFQFDFTPPAVLGDLAAFSSPGPTRDGRVKPDIMAPASAIVSTLSADAAPTVNQQLVVPDGKHWALPGTSFSSPHIAGIYAQMLALNPNLDAIELRKLATGTARVDAFVTPAVPNSNWGYGKVNALAMADRAVQNVADLKPSGFTGSFSWTGLPTATTYNLYRGDTTLIGPGYYGSCFATGLPTPSFNDATVPIPGGGFFYLVTGVWNGVEGSLGNTSDGVPRVNSSPCP